MKRHWIEYTDKRKQGPMTYWVHVPCGADPTDVNPPYPVAIPDTGALFGGNHGGGERNSASSVRINHSTIARC